MYTPPAELISLANTEIIDIRAELTQVRTRIKALETAGLASQSRRYVSYTNLRIDELRAQEEHLITRERAIISELLNRDLTIQTIPEP